MPPYLSPLHIASPSLPPRCEPANDVLYWLSATFHSCVPTNLALVSTLLGTCSIVSWLFAQLPQIYKNYKVKSTSGLSVFFLTEWLLGDLTNLLGCLLTGQASWQVIIATYYVFVDCALCGQWVWYELLHHGRPLRPIWGRWRGADNDPLKSSTRNLRRVPTSASPMPSPKTVLYITLLFAVLSTTSSATPIHSQSAHITTTTTTDSSSPTASEIAGNIFSWMSTFLYLGSRLPQLYKNQIRKSTAGLSPTLFAAAFFGNLFYSTSLLTNPCAWSDFAPGTGAGWVSPAGSIRADWVLRAAPFFLGAAGVLLMDAAVGLQFYHFGDAEPRGRALAAHDDEIIITIDENGVPRRRRLHWRRVSGWMRGWAPAVSVAATPSVSRATTPADTPRSARSPASPSSSSAHSSSPRTKSIPIRGTGDALDEARALLGTSRHASPRSYGALSSPR
jgi:uncharacterized protein with PQ loop repeat